MAESERQRLGDMLVAAGLVTEEQVEEALAKQKQLGQRLGETLVSLGYVSEPQMTQIVSNQLTIPWVNLYHVDFSRELLDLVPASLAQEHSLVPVYVRNVRSQGDTLYIAMEDPMNLDVLQLVADRVGLPVKPMVASPTDIQNAIRVYYLGLAPLEEAPKKSSLPAPRRSDIEELELGDDELQELADSMAPPAAASPDEGAPADGEVEEDEGPTATPSIPPPARPAGGFLTLTLLDGTQVRLPSPGAKKAAAETEEEEKPAERGLTTRDLIHALQARAAGEDVSDVVAEDQWEPLVAALLSVLLRKGLVSDWEFVDEWKKQLRKVSRAAKKKRRDE
ncbi:MAG: hypothetical protein RLP09_17980 [Sandaracinaceae bacterium]